MNISKSGFYSLDVFTATLHADDGITEITRDMLKIQEFQQVYFTIISSSHACSSSSSSPLVPKVSLSPATFLYSSSHLMLVLLPHRSMTASVSLKKLTSWNFVSRSSTPSSTTSFYWSPTWLIPNDPSLSTMKLTWRDFGSIGPRWFMCKLMGIISWERTGSVRHYKGIMSYR